MNVLYVSKALIASAYRDKIREMERSVRMTSVIPRRWGREPVEPSSPGDPEPHRVPVRLSGHNHLHFYPGAADWLDAAVPDLVHIDEEPYSLVTLQLGALCRRRSTPFVFFAWQNLERRLPPPFSRVRSFVFRHATGAIAGTDGAAAALGRAGWVGPLAVVPQFGVNPERFRPDSVARSAARQRYGIADGEFVVGYGGRLVSEKGVHTLLDAFARLPAADPPASLLFIGAGPETRALRERAQTLAIAERVRFAGRVDSTGMPAVLSALDVLVLPTTGTRTWTEQFGRILIEAMACGVPVAGSRCGEIPSVIGDAGDVFPPGDISAIAAILESYRLHESLRVARGHAGRERVLALFTQRRIADRTTAFYAALLAREEVAA
jgi:glycosyltransferase involved in cell wall biosynthesis